LTGNSARYFKVPNTLSEHEERQVQEILARLASDVKRRRLMVYPFFKDFDRVSFHWYLI
jgi:hypothetical protein